MAAFRPIKALCLTLMLVLTSGAMAVMRGQTQVAGQIVLCTGTGPVAVQVDAQGQPVGPAHICPDCALGLFDAAVTAYAAPPCLDARVSVLATVQPPATTPFVARHAPRARAPPFA